MFGKKKEVSPEDEAPLACTGQINGLTKLKGRGFILDAGTQQSIFFTRAACADFDQLAVGQNVTFLRERDPADRLRVHAIDVRSV